MARLVPGAARFTAYLQLRSVDPARGRGRSDTLIWRPALFGGVALVRTGVARARRADQQRPLPGSRRCPSARQGPPAPPPAPRLPQRRVAVAALEGTRQTVPRPALWMPASRLSYSYWTWFSGRVAPRDRVSLEQASHGHVHLNQVYPGTPHATPPCFMAAVHCTLVLSSIYACADRGSIRLPSR